MDALCMSEGLDDQATEDEPSLAPSVPLSYALTILGIRHQWHCSFLKVDSDRDGKSLAQPSWKVRYVNVQFCESEKLEKWWQNLNLNWAIEHARLFHVYTYVCTLTILDIRHQCIVLFTRKSITVNWKQKFSHCHQYFDITECSFVKAMLFGDMEQLWLKLFSWSVIFRWSPVTSFGVGLEVNGQSLCVVTLVMSPSCPNSLPSRCSNIHTKKSWFNWLTHFWKNICCIASFPGQKNQKICLKAAFTAQWAVLKGNQVLFQAGSTAGWQSQCLQVEGAASSRQ